MGGHGQPSEGDASLARRLQEFRRLLECEDVRVSGTPEVSVVEQLAWLQDAVLAAFARCREQEHASRRTEEALRDSEERLRIALDAANLGTWDLDLATGVAERSLRHDQIWGFTELQPEWGYAIAMQRVVPEDRPLIEAAYAEAMRTGILSHENRVIWPDGSIHWIVANGRIQRDSQGRPARVIGVVADITERKQAVEALQQLNATLEQRVRDRTAALEATNKELEAFSYSVSHDLRAPLRSIDGFSRILLEQLHPQLDARGQDYLSRIRTAAVRMGRLIDDMLKLSRIGRVELRRVPVNLSELAEAVIADLRQRDPERRVQVEISPGLEVTGDTELLRIVLENLLGNAWKFTGKTPGACMWVGATHQDGERVFFVRDNGAGFDMSYADKLFTPFQRLHTEAEFPGTGIGLAIVQRIITRHGGRVWAEGKAGEGATIYFTLGDTQG